MRALIDRPALKISFSVVLLLSCCALPVWGAQEDPVRASAFQLFKDGNYAEALPIFEKLAANLKAKVVIQHEPDDIAKLPAFPEVAG